MYHPIRPVPQSGNIVSRIRRRLTKYGYYGLSVVTLLTGFEPTLRVIGLFIGRSKPGSTRIRARKTGLMFTVRGAADVWSVKEAVLDRFYQRYGFDFEPAWTVLDIGAGLGEFTLLAARADQRNRVYAFEPHAGSFALLQENVTRNGLVNIVAVNDALSSRTGPLMLDVSNSEPVHQQSRRDEGSGGPQRHVVKSVSLGDLLNTYELDVVDLVKLDCEGAEYDILLNAPAWVLDRIHRIVLEYHDEFTPHVHGDLVRFLEHAGFSVETFPNPVHPDLGYLRAARPGGAPSPASR